MNKAATPSVLSPQSSVLLTYIVPFVLNMALVAWLAFGLDPHVNGRDFIHNGWMGARLILNGQNPYDPDQQTVRDLAGPYLSTLRSEDGSGYNTGDTYNAVYPYWALLLQTPLALLDFPAALIVWTLLSGALLLAGLYLMLAAARQRLALMLSPLIWGATLLVFGLISIFFQPTLLHLFLGQYSILMMFLLALLFATMNDGVWIAPLSLALATMKPQLSALVVAIVLLGWLWQAQWRKVVVALGAMAALYLLPVLIAPNSFSGWFSVNFLVQKQSTRLIPASSSWWGLCWQLARPVLGDWWLLLATLLSLATLALLFNPLRRALAARDFMPVLPLAIIVTLLVTPYTIGYDQVILLLPAAWLWLMLWAQEGLARILRLSLAVWLTILPLWQLSLVADTGRNYPRIIQTLALLGLYYLIYYATNERTGEPLTEQGFVVNREVTTG